MSLTDLTQMNFKTRQEVNREVDTELAHGWLHHRLVGRIVRRVPETPPEGYVIESDGAFYRWKVGGYHSMTPRRSYRAAVKAAWRIENTLREGDARNWHEVNSPNDRTHLPRKAN